MFFYGTSFRYLNLRFKGLTPTKGGFGTRLLPNQLTLSDESYAYFRDKTAIR